MISSVYTFWVCVLLVVDGIRLDKSNLTYIQTYLSSSESTGVTTDGNGHHQNVAGIYHPSTTIPLSKPDADPRCHPGHYDNRVVDMGYVHSPPSPKISISNHQLKNNESIDAGC